MAFNKFLPNYLKKQGVSQAQIDAAVTKMQAQESAMVDGGGQGGSAPPATPWLLYAIGAAAVYFLFLRKKKK